MTILIGRYAGHVTLNSTATGRIAAVTAEEWANLIDRIKAGQLDYTLKPAGGSWRGKKFSEMTDDEIREMAGGAP